MKILNWKYEETNNYELQKKIQRCLDLTYAYLLKNFPEISEEENFKEKYDKLIVIDHLIENGKHKYHVKKNGKLYLLNSSSASSETGNVDQEFNEETLEWNFSPGIIAHSSLPEHIIIHELIHYFSRNRKVKIVNGELKDKAGFDFVVYDKDDNVLSREYSNTFITEGITEYLACKISGHMPTGYLENLMLASILNIGNEELTKVYFSKNPEDIVEYNNKFDKITKNNFFQIFNVNKNLKNNEKIPSNKIQEVIELCINYKINSAKTIEELNDYSTKLNNYIKDIYFLDVLRIYKINVATIEEYINNCKKSKEKEFYSNIELKEGYIMDYKEQLMNLINTFNEIKRTNGSKEQMNNMIMELLDLQSSIENANLTDEYRNDLFKVINSLKQKIQEYKLQVNNENETPDLIANYQSNFNRVQKKSNEYGDRIFYEPDLLRELIREYINLRNELDLPDIKSAFLQKGYNLEAFTQVIDKKISDLKAIDITYNESEYDFGGRKR